MYIGPWQEYNLSRSKRVDQTSVHNEIEKALINSLDPEAAKIAIAAMSPVLSKITAPSVPSSSRSLSYQSNTRTRRRRQLTNLPPVGATSSYSSFSARDFESASPMSDRSTKSEPIHLSIQPNFNSSLQRGNSPLTSSKKKSPVLPKLTMENVKALSDNSILQHQEEKIMEKASKPSMEQSGEHSYNAPAMLNFLRLERNKRARAEISKLTGWRNGLSGIAEQNGSTGLSEENTNEQVLKKSTKVNKLEQVEQMKRLYMQEKAPKTELTLSAGTNSTNNNPIPTNQTILNGKVGEISTKPIEEELPWRPKSPKMTDKDLTESDLLAVSKYFSGSSGFLSEQETNNVVFSPSKVSLPPIDHTSSKSANNSLNSSLNNGFNKHVSSTTKIQPLDFPQNNGSSKTKPLLTSGNPKLKPSSPNLMQREKKNIEREVEGVGENERVLALQRQDSYKSVSSDHDLASNLDELYVGGIDGLLNWSKQLEFDDSYS